MRISAIMLVPLLVVAASCGGGSAALPKSGDSTIAAPVDTSPPSDQDVINKIYDPAYSVPQGFFIDERASTSQSYTVHHVMDSSASYELCTDDFEVAEAWETADNAARSVNGFYVGAYENERYFEFIRELSYDDDVGNIGDLTSPGFARIFKCSNTVRDGVDRALLSGFAGTLNTRPLSDAAVREFAEYFWQFTFFPERYKKVLSSHSDNDPSSLDRTLLLGFASTQGTGRCDRIEVVEWRFVADPVSGVVTSSFETVRGFEAELVSGSPTLCQ